jgi:hypothetical protein
MWHWLGACALEEIFDRMRVFGVMPGTRIRWNPAQCPSRLLEYPGTKRRLIKLTAPEKLDELVVMDRDLFFR